VRLGPRQYREHGSSRLLVKKAPDRALESVHVFVEEVPGPRNPHHVDAATELFRVGRKGSAIAKLVLFPLHKQKRASAPGLLVSQQTDVAKRDRESERDQRTNPGVSFAHPKGDDGPKREPPEEKGQIGKFIGQPVKRGLGILLLTNPVVVDTGARTDTSEIESKHVESGFVQRLGGTKDRLRVHRAPVKRMGMAKHRRAPEGSFRSSEVRFKNAMRCRDQHG
jgi:hypothetical protein